MVRPTPIGAVVFHILGEVDRSHTTATQFTLDRVAVGQGFFEPDYCFVGHGRTCSWSRTQGTAYRSWSTVHVHHCDGWCCIDAVKVGPASP